MHPRTIVAAMIATITVTAPSSSHAETPDLIPRRTLFAAPSRVDVTVSPDGASIAFRAPHEGVMTVWVQPIGGDTPPRPAVTDRNAPVRGYAWSGNGEQIIVHQDRGTEHGSLHAIDPAGDQVVALAPGYGRGVRLVATSPTRPRHVLIAVTPHEVLRVDTRTGASELALESVRPCRHVHADHDLTVRAVTRTTTNGGLVVEARDDERSPWYELVRWSAAERVSSRLIGFSRDGRRLFLIDSRGADAGRLYDYSVEDDDAGYTTLFGDERAEISDVLRHPATGLPQAVATERTRRVWTVLDPAVERDCRVIAAIGDGDWSVVSRDRGDHRWIVAYDDDDGPVAYHLYDRRTKQATPLFCDREALLSLPLASMKPVVIRARDGLELVSYLTTPVGAPSRDLPMVLLVHGGPWTRDAWGYNGWHQWLANRGYAVLSVNYRGSAGFGKRFLVAGDREWAGRMHDDLVDAVNWAVSERIADPDRVAIMGSSYGGYAALVGLAFTPEFFAAGISMVGPTCVRTLVESVPDTPPAMRAIFERRIGGLDEPDFLDRISPLHRADAIRRPLLMGQGLEDRRAKPSDSRRLVDTMRDHGQPVTYVVFRDEGHSLSRARNSLAFAAIAEAFLSQHLGGRHEPIGDAIRASTAEIRAGREFVPGLINASADRSEGSLTARDKRPRDGAGSK